MHQVTNSLAPTDSGETQQFVDIAFRSACAIVVIDQTYLEILEKDDFVIPCSTYAEELGQLPEKNIFHVGTGFKLNCTKKMGNYPSFDFIVTCAHVMREASSIIIKIRGKNIKFDETWLKLIFAAFKVMDNMYLVVSFQKNLITRIVLMNDNSHFLKDLWEKIYGQSTKTL